MELSFTLLHSFLAKRTSLFSISSCLCGLFRVSAAPLLTFLPGPTNAFAHCFTFNAFALTTLFSLYTRSHINLALLLTVSTVPLTIVSTAHLINPSDFFQTSFFQVPVHNLPLLTNRYNHEQQDNNSRRE